MVAVVFAGDQVGQLPVQKAGVLAQHVAQARRDHLHGGLGQNLRVPDDCDRRLRVIGDLDVVDDQRRTGGHKAVHGRSGRQNDIVHTAQEADILAQVVDGPRADRQDQVRVLRHMEEEGTYSFFIRHKFRIGQDKGFKGKAGGCQPVRSGLARSLPGIDIRDQIGSAKAKRTERVRQPVQGAAPDIDGFQVRAVHTAAAAVHFFSEY